MSNLLGNRASLALLFDRGFFKKNITFTRASQATYYDRTKTLRIASNDEPRLDHDPVTGKPKGLLIEESRTNLTPNSDGLNGFSPTRCTLTLNTVVSPDGTINGSTIEATTDNANDYIAEFSAISGGIAGKSFAFSVWIKSNTGSPTATLFMYGSTGTEEVKQNVNIQITNEWQRYSLSGTFTGGAVSGTLICRIDIRQNGTSNANLGDKIDVWGAQIEQGSFPTSYIPTAGATATRSADNAVIDGQEFADFYNQEEGTFVVEGVLISEELDNQVLLMASDGTVNNRYELRYNTTALSTARSHNFADSIQISNIQPTGLNNQLEIRKLALSYNGSRNVFSVNGANFIEETLGTSNAPNNIRLYIAKSAFGVNVNAHIKSIVYFPVALPDADLQLLTDPGV